jgi:hypothetical protein
MSRVRGMLAAAILAGVAGGCQTEQRVVKYNPFLANIPGAETAVKPVGNRFEGYKDPSVVEGDKTIIENPDGSVTLVAKSVRHLMTNIMACLEYEDDEVLLEQVISEQTKGQFRSEGKQPEEAVEFLKKNRDDIAKLFARMPFGEHSPNIILKQPARRTVVLELTGLATRDLRFTELWAVMEQGNWKLLWIR